MPVLLVALGSALGGVARWSVANGMSRLLGTAFPFGTLVVNLTGSLFLGWFLTVLASRLTLGPGAWLRADELRLLVAVGFTGAYTTFSTFEFETHALMGDGQWILAALYVAGSVFLGLVAMHAGVILARTAA